MVVFLLLAMGACNGNKLDVRVFEEQLHRHIEEADALTVEMSTILQSNAPDSIIRYVDQDLDNITVCVLRAGNLIFWTGNKISFQQVSVYTPDRWFYQQFDNAHCICKWSNTRGYNLLTIVTIKYHYRHETAQLQNKFIDRYVMNDDIELIQAPNLPNAVFSKQGDYLFSLYSVEKEKNDEGGHITESFSYSELLSPEDDEKGGNAQYLSRLQIRFYFALGIALCLICIGLIVYSIYKYRGWKNLRLSYRFGIVFISLFLVSFVCMFWLSVVHMRNQYEARQQEELRQKTLYIQKALQEIYYWNVELNQANTASLNIELRDLSLTYKTDIHVYDKDGVLMGSSQPILFNEGFLSRRIAPRPYFRGNPNLILYEEIGNIEYLSAYTDLYNGDYVQLGYIAVPSFISSEEVGKEVDEFLGRLIPVYIIILLSYMLFSTFLGRQITAPINMVVRTLEKFRLDKQNERIVYKPKDEIGLVVNEYNKLVDKLEESAVLLAKSEREGAWKTMARQIAHEINNPLTPMKLTIQQLQRVKQIDEERFEESFERSTTLLIEQIDNLSRIAAMFSNFAKLPEIRLSKVDIAKKLNSVAALFATNAANATINCSGTDEPMYATTDSEQITQVLNNLVMNAIQAVSRQDNGVINIALCDDDKKVTISIHDNGCGIPKNIQDKIFRPNFTTKNTGMGLGLAISKNIVEESGGNIGVVSEEGVGTMFCIELKKEA